NSRYIETVPRVGYRFIAPVAVIDPARADAPPQATTAETSPSAIPRPTQSLRFLRNRTLIASLAVAAVLGALYVFRPAVPPPRVLRIRQITHLGTVEAQQNLVTDGPRLYFRDRTGGVRSLKYVATDGGEPNLLPNSSSQFDIDGISADGSRLLVSSIAIEGNNPLWSLPAGGGEPRRLGSAMAIDSQWSPSGRDLAYMTAENALYVANADGSEPRKLCDVPGTPYCPRWSPDAKRLRFVVIHSETGPVDLWEVPTDGSAKAHPLLPDWGKASFEWGGSWSLDGKYFFFHSSVQRVNCIWALREKTGGWRKTSWEPVQLTAGPISFSSPRSSRDGKTLFVVGEEKRGELLRYDVKSRSLAPFLPKFSADHLVFSRDGQWIAYVRYPDGSLWRSRPDGTEKLQLNLSSARAYRPRWSPDGQWIVFTGLSALGQPQKLFRVSAEGFTPPEELPPRDAAGWSEDWSPNGSSIVYGRTGKSEAPETADLATLDLPTGRISPLPGSQGLQAPQWSPDGRYLVARSIDSKDLKLFDPRTGQWADLGIENADYATWSADSAYLYFNTLATSPSRSIFRMSLRDRHIENLYAPRDLSLTGVYGVWSGVAPDGSLLFLRDAGTRDIYAIDVDLP
ncbi:MAG TPA: hypothetical protein VE077_05655, partial [Candidatus Methylomirabilis sp.]|nr:hypothetical protein [Candidatus Methylomirabilis sp.]